MRRSVATLVLTFLVCAACGPSAERQEADRDEIKANLEVYLPLLGEAYATGNLELLREWAVEKEMARVMKRLDDLGAQGRRLVPTFRQVTVEDVNVWNNSNAFVSTVEVWDLQILAIGTENVLAEELAQSNRVKYQLKRDEDHWRVLFRTIQE
ncbi:MAG: hypothetical protein WBG49_05035 [Thermoanaerobaculia bacterium]